MNPSTPHLIIVGGVAAGTKAAARARRLNPGLRITLYQDEAEVAYSACGQPYLLSGVIPQRDALVIRRPADFAADNIEVRVHHRVTRLNPAARTVIVHDRGRDQTSEVGYDRLILATGARSRIPELPGAELEGVLSLRSWTELERFQASLAALRPQTAVIAGSGYIGLELLETLSRLGLQVTLLARNPRLFAHLDADMSPPVHDYLRSRNVGLIVADPIARCLGRHGRVSAVVTGSGQRLAADLVVLGLGIQPNVELARDAGIRLGASGAIAVDSRMETSIEGIYAAGDCAESRHRISGQPVWAPFGDIANLQGRVAGENAAGGSATFPGVLGSAILKTFDLNIALTGLGETAAAEAGFEPVSALLQARDKARYYPEARPLSLKLIADAGSGRLLGAQAVGHGAVDKYIDIAATALLGRLDCHELENADLAYAPPFSPVLSPIIVAAGMLRKKLRPGSAGRPL